MLDELEQTQQDPQQAAQEARLLELRAKRETRLQAEAMSSLPDEAKKIIAAENDPMTLFRSITAQARAQRKEQIAAEIETAYKKEIQTMRDRVGRLGPGHNSQLRECLKGLEKQYADDREKRELEAEVHDSEVERIFASLDSSEKAIFKTLWEEAQKPEVKLKQAQQASMSVNEQKQRELYKQFVAEATPYRGQGTKISNIRQKYFAAGWDGSARD